MHSKRQLFCSNRRPAGLPLFLALALLVAAAGAAFGQGGYGAIAGRITDPSGAVVPGVTVAAIQIETNLRLQTVSTSTGDYELLQLRPGAYSIEVEAAGFKKVERTGIQVRVADRLTVDIQLEVGATTETVTVMAEVPLLRTQDAETGEVINSLMIQNLPQLNRNPLELLQLSGNVSGSGMAGGETDLRISGGRTSSVDYLVDGGSILSGRRHDVRESSIPRMEEVSEFKVITNGISAEYGRVSGGLVTIATRGGTNELHGQAFEYFWNELFNANAWLQNATSEYVPGKKAKRAAFHRNIFGGQIGGPVYIPKVYDGRNKTFFLFQYEGYRHSEAGVANITAVPTDAEREGDLTGTLFNGEGPLMWDPLSWVRREDGTLEKTALLGGDGKHVPASMIHPVSRLILEKVPRQNRTPTPGFSQMNAFVGAGGGKNSRNYWSVRLDENFTDNHRLMFRFTRNKRSDGSIQWFGDYSPGWNFRIKDAPLASLNYDWTIRPTLLFNAHASVTHEPNFNGAAWEPGDFDLREWPIDENFKNMVVTTRLPFRALVESAPGVGGWGNYALNNLDAPHFNTLTYTTYNFSAAISKIYNKHTIKTGMQHRRFYDNFWESGLGWMYFAMSGLTRSNWGNAWTDGAPLDQLHSNSWGQYLLGMMDWGQQSAPWTMNLGFNYYAAYVQDDIRLNPKMTLNVGLRWEMETPVTERNNKITAYDPDAPSWYHINPGWTWEDALTEAGVTPEEMAMLPKPEWAVTGQFPNGRLVVPGTPEHPGRTVGKYFSKHFAPRVGMAYQLSPSTVLRASFNTLYMSTTGDYYSMWTTVVPSTSAATCFSCERDPESGNFVGSWDQVFREGNMLRYAHTTGEVNYAIGGNLGGPVWSTKSDTPYEFAWSIGLQRQWKSFLFEATYNGNRSDNLLVQNNRTPFPQALIDPKYATVLAKRAKNPIAGQTQDAGYANDPMRVGTLILSNPTRGGDIFNGYNGGMSRYHGLNLRVEKRLSQGITFLANYTLSQNKDNVGGPETNFWGMGVGSKGTQSFQTYKDLYGVSPIDHTHRIIIYEDVQLPFGKGRKFLGDLQGSGGSIVNALVGGWEVAGTFFYTTGGPIAFGVTNGNLSDNQGIGSLSGFILGDGKNVSHPQFNDNNQVLRGPADQAPAVTRFDPSKFDFAKEMTPGNMPPVFPYIRNPGFGQWDASLMKKFNLGSEGRFVQFRIEASNVLNLRGLGGYNTTLGDANFGYITGASHDPRRMQLSARIVF